MKAGRSAATVGGSAATGGGAGLGGGAKAVGGSTAVGGDAGVCWVTGGSGGGWGRTSVGAVCVSAAGGSSGRGAPHLVQNFFPAPPVGAPQLVQKRMPVPQPAWSLDTRTGPIALTNAAAAAWYPAVPLRSLAPRSPASQFVPSQFVVPRFVPAQFLPPRPPHARAMGEPSPMPPGHCRWLTVTLPCLFAGGKSRFSHDITFQQRHCAGVVPGTPGWPKGPGLSPRPFGSIGLRQETFSALSSLKKLVLWLRRVSFPVYLIVIVWPM